MATTQVLLTENIPGLGAEADVVKVRAGYARNFLFPQKKALELNASTLRSVKNLQAKRAEREAKELTDAEDVARKINKLKLTLTIETGESGKAFGSITSSDIAKELHSQLGGLEIDRHRIVLDQPIKGTGSFEVPIKLHSEVTAKLNLTVKSSSQPEAAAEGEEGAEGSEQGFKAKPKARHTKA